MMIVKVDADIIKFIRKYIFFVRAFQQTRPYDLHVWWTSTAVTSAET